MEIKIVSDLLEWNISKFDHEVFVAGKKAGEWKTYSSRSFSENAEYVAMALLENGISKGDCVAIMSGNRPEWNLVDFGCALIGAISIPIHPALSSSDVVYILNQTKTKLAFAGNKFMFNRLKDIQDQATDLDKIISFQKSGQASSFEDFVAMGKQSGRQEELNQARTLVEPEDIYTILYTSGTTGTPKGVVITHNNFAKYLPSAAPVLMKGTQPGDKAISFLPLPHVFERSVFLKYMYYGIRIYYAEDFQSLVQNIQEVKPNMLTSVPLLLERVYDNIQKMGATLEGDIKQKFDWAMQLALKYDPNKEYSEQEKQNYALADQYVYSKWRAVLGGNLKKIICGGAAVPQHLQHIFWAAGMPVMEGYGITEVSGLFSITNFDALKFNTVGKPISVLDVKIAPDGEILCKGDSVISSYYKNPEATAEAIDEEGWFHTGDMGKLDEEGYLSITGRKKVLFKTKSGVYVSPENVENLLKESEFIKYAMIWGENQEYLSALIVPDFEIVRNLCDKNGITFTTPEQMVDHQLVKTKIDEGIARYNAQALPSQLIKKYVLIHNEWTTEGGELTPTAKIRRQGIIEKYKKQIESIAND